MFLVEGNSEEKLAEMVKEQKKILRRKTFRILTNPTLEMKLIKFKMFGLKLTVDKQICDGIFDALIRKVDNFHFVM